MTDPELNSNQTDEETLANEISDEALEATCADLGGYAPTFAHVSYCFTCPGIPLDLN